MRHKTTGTLDCHTHWGIVWVDAEIGRYYYRLIPHWKNAQRQKYDSHITVVSKYDEPVSDWRKLQNTLVTLEYSGTMRQVGKFFVLDVWSDQILDIRRSIGLADYPPGHSCYHITVGNCK